MDYKTIDKTLDELGFTLGMRSALGIDSKQKRIAIAELISQMDKGHDRFLRKLIFGRYRNYEWQTSMLSKETTGKDLIELYELDYSVFVGMQARLRMEHGI